MIAKVYNKIKEDIEARIDSGEFTDKLPGLNVLAKEFSVNPRTISKAINLLAEEGKVVVRGTQGTFITSNNEKAQSSNLIGFLGLNYDNKASQAQLDAVESYFAARGKKMIALGLSRRTMQKTPSIMCMLNLEGILMTNSLITSDIVYTLKKNNVKFVSLNAFNETPGVNWVDFNKNVYVELWSKLLKKGFTKIACVHFNFGIKAFEQWFEHNYCKVMTKNNCFQPNYLISDDDQPWYKQYGENYFYEFAYHSTCRLLVGPERPQVIFIPIVELAGGVCAAVKDNGLSVDKDIFVVCFANMSNLNIVPEGVSMVLGLDYEKRALHGAQMLYNLLENKATDISEEIEVPVALESVNLRREKCYETAPVSQ